MAKNKIKSRAYGKARAVIVLTNEAVNAAKEMKRQGLPAFVAYPTLVQYKMRLDVIRDTPTQCFKSNGKVDIRRLRRYRRNNPKQGFLINPHNKHLVYQRARRQGKQYLLDAFSEIQEVKVNF